MVYRKIDQNISAPTATDENIKTTSVTLTAIDIGYGVTKYGVSTKENIEPTIWQNELTFENLSANTTYYFFAKYVGNNNYKEAVSTGTMIKTKNLDA